MTQNRLIASSKTERTRDKNLSVLLVFLAAGLWAAETPVRADITNSAVARGTYNSAVTTSAPSLANVPVTAPGPALSIVKTASPDTNVAAGQVVTYTYTVTNTGNTTLQNISLNDVHLGSGTPPVPGNETLTNDNGTLGDSTDATPANGVWSVLAPGDVLTFTSTYTVTQQDVDTRQ